MEPLSDPRAEGFATGNVRVVEKVARDRSEVFDGCDQQRRGTRAGDAGSPAAREACGPPAP
eukprot:6851842-Alexandrium_andersonii.AAC.1